MLDDVDLSAVFEEADRTEEARKAEDANLIGKTVAETVENVIRHFLDTYEIRNSIFQGKRGLVIRYEKGRGPWGYGKSFILKRSQEIIGLSLSIQTAAKIVRRVLESVPTITLDEAPWRDVF